MSQPLTQIAFTTDRHGRPLAYRDSRLAMRYFRVSVDEADLLIATGQAVEVPFRPYSR